MIDTIDLAYDISGGHSPALHDKKVGSLVIQDDRVLSANKIEGIEMSADPDGDRLVINLKVLAGYSFKDPLHLCFGVLSEEMAQKIDINIKTGEDSKIDLQAHCVFPNAIDVLHKMDADILIGPNSKYTYNEVHYHGEKGHVRVVPAAKIILEDGAQLVNNFSLIQGAVGKMNFDYDIECRDNSLCSMTAKVYGKYNDDITIKERAHLKGNNSHGILEARMVIRDNARTDIYNEIIGEGDGARGHMDCTEILAGKNAYAKATPIAVVTNQKAKVTHEAAIGSIDSDQLNLLMSRGLTPDQATEVIVNGLLK
ncbi:MAG TPA: SufD family Fe-S cluster assembly protein [bacterium]|nr:SufD family Fe-S cluster assembly protein [bacterium]